MNKIKTVLIIFLAIVVVSILLNFLPTQDLGSRIPFLNRFYTNTILEIITINGKAEVKIDGKDYGETPLTVTNLPQGDYTVELNRISDLDDFYKRQTFNVKLTKNTTSRLEVEIGPSGITHGSLLYYTPLLNLSKGVGTLSILSDVPKSRVYIDGEYIEQTPVIARQLETGEYELEISVERYESLEIPFLIEEGYLLNIRSYLFPIPVNLDIITNE